MGAVSEVPLWLLQNGMDYNAELGSDNNSDGVCLLMAYALKLDPNQNQASSMPRPVISDGNLSLRYYSASAEVNYQVETSGDLVNWNTSGVAVSAADAEGYRTASVPIVESARYLRLEVAH